MKQIVRTILFFSFLSCHVHSQTIDRDAINTLMDEWHKAAANADEEVFFGSMTENCIYIGTDPDERWLRDSLKKWSAPYFERSSAWSFTPYDRHVNFSEDGKTAWFDELLETWMGICRASGILIKTENGWKISHYQLSVTVHNDLIKEFIELIKKDPRNSFLE